MDRFEGRAWLEWWANSLTRLVSQVVAVVLSATEGGWDAHGRVVNANDDELEALKFLYDPDPVFQLRFEDDSTVMATVQLTECRSASGGTSISTAGSFRLTEYTAPSGPAVHTG